MYGTPLHALRARRRRPVRRPRLPSPAATGVASGPSEPTDAAPDAVRRARSTVPMRVTSTAYDDGAEIPPKYTCDGADVTPPWNLHDVPGDAAALAAVFHDPDSPGGDWVHWLAWDIDPGERAWLEGTGGRDVGTVGRNGWGNDGYGGPCPHAGRHRYVLEVYALDAPLGLPEGSDRAAFDRALEGHVLAEARLTGTYRRG